MRTATLSMTPVKKRKRFHIHNAPKSCGNCGLWLFFGDEIIHIDGKFTLSDSGYYHADYRGCQAANDEYERKIFVRGKVVLNG